MDGIVLADAALAFTAWNALWDGALAAYDRDRTLITEKSEERIAWRLV
jgi:hypothetical protein